MIIIKDLDFDYIKKMFCKYNCNVNKEIFDTTVYVQEIQCPKCYEFFSSWHDVEVDLEDNKPCQLCQIDNFIKELQNNL